MKILFIAGHEFLYNPQNGGQNCSLRNYKLLVDIYGQENIYLVMFSNYIYNKLPPNSKIFPTHKNDIQRVVNTISKRNVCNFGTFIKLKKYVESININLIFADSSTIGYIVKKIQGNIPTIFFFHNIERNYVWKKYKHEGIKYAIALYSYYLNEKKAVKNNVILLNKRDEKELMRVYKRNADYILPITFTNEFDYSRVQENRSTKINLLFVGSLFQPNYEGLLWFVDNVMSRLNQEKYLLTIVGKNLEHKKKELQRQNVDIVGTVEDLSDYYYKADAVVIPIFYGDGMKVKTAEAMMYGKKILATTEALEGYDVKDIDNIILCNTVEDYLINIKKMYGHYEQKYYEDVRKKFLDNYETSSIIKGFEKFIDYVCISKNK